MGRDVSNEEVAEAAKAASFAGKTPSIPATALPSGVKPLVTAPIALASLGSPGAQSITYNPTEARRLWLTAVDGGMPLFELYRFFVADDASTPPFADWWGAIGSIRIEGTTVIAARAAGISRAELDRFVDAAHRDQGGEWARLRTATADRPPEALLPGVGGPYVAVLSGRFASGQWVVGIQPSGRGYHIVFASSGPDDRDHGGGAGGSYDPGSGDRLIVWPGFTISGRTNFAGTMYTGVAPAAAASVTVTYGGREVAAALSPEGALSTGGRFWAAFIEHRDPRPLGAVVIARDLNESEIGRAERSAM
jgi:hypothetical protein